MKILIAGNNKWLINSASLFIEELNPSMLEFNKGPESLVTHLIAKKYDVLILIYSEETEFKFEETKKLFAKFSDLKVLILSTSKNKNDLKKLSQIGTLGIIYFGDCCKACFIEAVNNLIEGKAYYCKTSYDILIGNFVNKEDTNNEDIVNSFLALSKREKEILFLIAYGYTNQAIAQKLKISPLTVKNHRKNLIEKMNCKNSAHLIFTAFQAGLLNVT